MKVGSLSTKDMLSDIGSMKDKALALKAENKPYATFLDHLLATNYFYEDNNPLPNIKQLAKDSGLSYDKVRKDIRDIYYDLVLNYDSRPVFYFSSVRYEFLLYGRQRDKFLDFQVENLPVVPRVGEEVNIPFFYAHLGVANFYVEEILNIPVMLTPVPFDSDPLNKFGLKNPRD